MTNKTDNTYNQVKTSDISEERLAKLKELFPDLFTDEGKLDPEELIHLVAGYDTDKLDLTERFEFNWYGKTQSKGKAFSPSLATLKPDSDRSVKFEESENLIIEGENLEALKLLRSAYFEKVKMIYIDPPYNTGKDFVYKDNFKESRASYWEKTGVKENGVKMDTLTESSGRYHSDWLSMMYSRLLLARDFLRDDGVIFVSIDDNEVYHLRKLMDEVFGEENFIAQFVWKRRASSAMAENLVSTDHEYVIAYQKGFFTGFKGTDKDYSAYKNPDKDSRGEWTTGDLTVGMTRDQRPNQFYDLVDPKTGKVYRPNPNRVWAYIQSSMQQLIEEERVLFSNDTSRRPMLKRFASELKDTVNPISTFVNSNKANDFYSGMTSEGTRMIQALMGSKLFDYPKPLSLIKSLISQISNDKDIVLDFFAGSGTTAQAVLELNEEDQGNRKFILVQIPEETPDDSEARKAGYEKISDITIERVKRVIKGYGDEPKPLDDGFKVFRLDKSTFPENGFAPDPDLSEEENVRKFEKYLKGKQESLFVDYDKDDLLYEVLLKQGFELNLTKERQEEFTENEVYWVTDGTKKALICLDKDLDSKTVEQLKNHIDKKFICLERAVDTTKKWNLKQLLKSNLEVVG